MSWLASACIVLSLAAAQVAPPNSQQKSGDAQQQNRQQPPPPANRITNRPQPPPSSRTPDPNKSEIRPGKHSASAANSAWPTREDVKRWLSWKPEFGWGEVVAIGVLVVAAGSAAVSFLTLIVTAWFLRYTYLMWKEMVRQNNNAERDREESKGTTEESQRSTQESLKLTRQQLEAYERPWVIASFEADTPIQFGMGGGMWVGFKVWLENIGHSIATDISFDAEIVPVDPIPTDYSGVVSAQDRISQKLKPLASGPVLFAGEKVPVFTRLNIVEVQKYGISYEGERYLSPCLAVVIKYCYPTSDREHTTRIGFIFGNNKEPVEGWFFVKIGEEMPKEKITVLRLPSGGGAD